MEMKGIEKNYSENTCHKERLRVWFSSSSIIYLNIIYLFLDLECTLSFLVLCCFSTVPPSLWLLLCFLMFATNRTCLLLGGKASTEKPFYTKLTIKCFLCLFVVLVSRCSTEMKKSIQKYGLCDTFPVTFNNHIKTLYFTYKYIFFRNYCLLFDSLT